MDLHEKTPDWIQICSYINQCDDEIWKLYSDAGSRIYLQVPLLDGKPRVSEQEPRFVLAAVLSNSYIPFFVEYPTTQKYGSSRKRRALFDLRIEPIDSQPINVEFKAKQCSSKGDVSRMKKDIIKLIKEGYSGIWFHILKAVDNDSLHKLLKSLKELISQELNAEYVKNMSQQILFHILVIEQGFSIQRIVTIREMMHDTTLETSFVDIRYVVKNKRLASFLGPTWELHRKH